MTTRLFGRMTPSREFQSFLPDGFVDDTVTDARLQQVDLGGVSIYYIYCLYISNIEHCTYPKK